ncbi:hypothetical protein EKO25_04970 [Bacillus sp. SAJ1]|nr:hypothetical protein EKO25_04970 [Bacillus sp. SAJ1]
MIELYSGIAAVIPFLNREISCVDTNYYKWTQDLPAITIPMIIRSNPIRIAPLPIENMKSSINEIVPNVLFLYDLATKTK